MARINFGLEISSGVRLFSACGIHNLKKNFVQMLRTTLLDSFSQALAKFLRPLRTGKQAPPAERADKSPVPPTTMGSFPRVLISLQSSAGVSCILSRGDVIRWFDEIQKMVWNHPPFFMARLGRADFKFTVHRNRIAINDLALKTLSDSNRQCGLAASRRTKYYNQQRIRWHG